jgi:hypothetical protein
MIRIEHNPSRRQLTVFGLSWLVFFGMLAALAWWKTGFSARAVAFGTIGATIPVAGLFWPGFLRIVYLFANYSTFPIGLAVSYLILTAIYFLLLTPLGLILRLSGHDPMKRRFARNAETYWTLHERKETSESYFQQF